jgi:hypothetical protein
LFSTRNTTVADPDTDHVSSDPLSNPQFEMQPTVTLAVASMAVPATVPLTVKLPIGAF